MTTPRGKAAEEYVEETDYISNENRNIAGNAFLAGWDAAVEACAEVARECGHSNVTNPAIDLFERHRRMGIQWCGQYTVAGIRALAGKEGK